MNIYLRHPRHGEKVATLEMEAVYDEGNGWVRFAPAEAAPVAPRRRRTPALEDVA
jgi:hypothetical protein